MTNAIQSLVQTKNFVHLAINMLIIAATTIVAYIDTVKAMLANWGLSPEATVLISAFVLLTAKEFLLNYKTTPNV